MKRHAGQRPPRWPDAEVGDGFQGGVKKRSKWVYFGLLKTIVFRTLYSQLTSIKTDIIIDTWP